MTKWIPIGDGPDDGQVWVAYRNSRHPDGWNLVVEWTPLSDLHLSEHLAEFWAPIERPTLPPIGGKSE